MTRAAAFPFRACGQDVVSVDRARILQPEFLMGGTSTTIGSFVHIAAFSSLVGGGDLVVARLEAELRALVYGAHGRYIPRPERPE